ncbi:hypothetical protein DRP04_06600 [Archaeoglobales archaeon]|nr:MAG: hypothetical protein DRP04_06600 [Archaeoglobales archaeon]
MRTYDEIIGFDYTNAEEWRDFIREKILPLHRSISKIIELRSNIEQLLNYGLPELIKSNEGVRQILLGGVDESGEYRANSLAKLYKELLGVSINPKEWVSLCKRQEIDASEYVRCNFSDTPFLRFIKDIKEITDKLVSLAGIGDEEIREDKIKEILENPEKIVNELKEMYTHMVDISANHSYYTFFILNTRCIPRYYIERAYPKLKSKFEEVTEFLGLEPKFVLDVKEEIKRDYTLLGHKENGLADLLYKLNGIIWEYFEKEEFRRIFELIAAVKDLKREYRERIDRELDRIGWRFPEYINPHMWGGSGRPYWYREYRISGILLDKCYEVPSWSRYSEREVEFNAKSIMELFDDISPALLLGKIDYYDDKYAECKWPPLFKNISEYTLMITGNRLRIRKKEG